MSMLGDASDSSRRVSADAWPCHTSSSGSCAEDTSVVVEICCGAESGGDSWFESTGEFDLVTLTSLRRVERNSSSSSVVTVRCIELDDFFAWN